MDIRVPFKSGHKSVRKIRNTSEQLGRRPILFYLKCLEDDSAELPGLLRREIEARNWFILCDSEHARSSTYVQQEVEIIRSIEGKVYEVVDLDGGIEEYLLKVERLSRRATVFISHSSTDREIAQRIGAHLREVEYQVFDSLSVHEGRSAIDDAASRGFVLILLSQRSIESRWVGFDIQYAKERAASIMPVIVADAPIVTRSLPEPLRTFQYFDLTLHPFEESMNHLVSALKTRNI